jgi:glycosyltransferase involved in cell wall biosynthesis
MYSDHKKPAVYVIIPAFNESKSIGKVIADIPDLVSETIVVNNASTDNTETIAKKQGATVLRENRKGYGYSCLKGIDYLQTKANPNDIIVFLDGDYSDFPDQISMLITPILESNFDMVIGSRALGVREPGSMLFQQIVGKWLATALQCPFYRFGSIQSYSMESP